MHHPPVRAVAAAIVLLLQGGCHKNQMPPMRLDQRPLEAAKAAAIIVEVLTERGYTWKTGESVRVSELPGFTVDFRIVGEAMAVEYNTEQDRAVRGTVPEADAKSRLHVLPGVFESDGDGGRSTRVYILFLHDRDFRYRPTVGSAEKDVTFLEVDSRLRRDLADFLSWYESAVKQR